MWPALPPRVALLPHFRGICHIFDDLATFFPHFSLLPHFATFFIILGNSLIFPQNSKKLENFNKK
jgi:hypothetical protein